MFVEVTHKGVVDSVQDPNGWHSHNVVLGPTVFQEECDKGKLDPKTCIEKLKDPNMPDYCIVHVTKDTFADLDIKG
ncbi:MAG: hypothetical protein KGI08_07950, partial [Thaumarchaeota archaeon]|nr:hypothetical protein [Nitrososphaerota archaeon]